jgi:hypothetical protein
MTPITEHPPVGATLPGSGCAGRENVRPASVAARFCRRGFSAVDAGSTLLLDLDHSAPVHGRIELAERLLAVKSVCRSKSLKYKSARGQTCPPPRALFINSGTTANASALNPRHRRTHGTCRTGRQCESSPVI